MQLPKNRILLVEDHPDTQELLLYLLRNDGYEVTPSGTCAQAFELAQRELFDLYMVDGLLPDGNGLALCRQLHDVNPNAPILFHSGLAYDADKQLAYDAGAQEYISKPADPDEITTTIARLINQSPSRYSASFLTKGGGASATTAHCN